MDVVVWLRSLGLGKYEAAFRENEIDGSRRICGRSFRPPVGAWAALRPSLVESDRPLVAASSLLMHAMRLTPLALSRQAAAGSRPNPRHK